MTEHCDVDTLSPRESDASKTAAVAAVVTDVDVDSDRIAAHAAAIDVASFPDAPFSCHGHAIRTMWCEPDASAVQVRGATYLSDSVKVPSGAALGKLLHVDLWTAPSMAERHHVARIERQRANSVLQYCAHTFPDSLVFILNIELPDARHTCVVSYWLLPPLRPATADAPHSDLQSNNFERLLDTFCNTEDDAFRTQRFKLIPDFATAPWVFQQLVPSRPALSGTKLTQHYYRERNYFELDLDVASSTIASSIGSLCCSWATYLDVCIFLTVQGEASDELPERVIGGVGFKYLDLAAAAPLPHTS